MCFSSSWLLGSPAFATCATFQRSILISRSITIWATNKWEIQMSGSSQISHVIVFLLCRNNIRVQKYANSSPLIPQKFSSCCLIKSGESTERWKFLLTNRGRRLYGMMWRWTNINWLLQNSLRNTKWLFGKYRLLLTNSMVAAWDSTTWHVLILFQFL